MQRIASPRWATLALAALAATGCSGGPNTPYPVRGTVVYEDGQPAKELAGGSVTFAPEPQDGRKISSGSIEEDGTFVLSSLRPRDGAAAGKYRAVIEPPEPEGDGGDAPARRRPLRGIIDPTSAAQDVTVEPRSNVVTLKVKRAAAPNR